MKYLFIAAAICATMASCKHQTTPIVSKMYVDSLISHFVIPQHVKDNDADMIFWKKRINPDQPRHVNESKYAATLITRFHEFGDINDVKQAEAILNTVSHTFNETLPGPFVALASSAMLQHRFKRADTLFKRAEKIGLDDFTKTTLSFDVNFELGRYTAAQYDLKKLKKANDYSYYFRRSKFDHYNGNMDSAIAAMNKAADLAKNSAYLKGIALSNVADLYVHSGNLQKAGELYKQCLILNSVDFHSMLGLGWLALIHDNNDALAKRLFEFVGTNSKLPDYQFKLYQMAQQSGNRALEKKYALAFVEKATDAKYGKMYNKYVIEIYNGILNDPAKAEVVSKNELLNRATPQTYAWYAYSLFKNHKKDQAYKVFQQYVSDRPLEGLELYYIGVMMKGLNKGYDAQEFFKAAEKNIFDLSPAMQQDLAANLEE
ncbi:MAG: hypothetical protein JWR05_1789 [Mucilaginibacter sp.]|nr:hypothetical protein [Mucilaginibacter sp.]